MADTLSDTERIAKALDDGEVDAVTTTRDGPVYTVTVRKGEDVSTGTGESEGEAYTSALRRRPRSATAPTATDKKAS